MRGRRANLTDEQIQEKISLRVFYSEKTNNLTAAVVVASCSALMLHLIDQHAPPGGRSALILWISSIVWTLVAAIGWRTPSAEHLKRLSREQQRHHKRSDMIWYHVWKGGAVAQFSLILLLIGLALLEDVGARAWVSMLTVGGYLLTFVLSFAQRRRILRVLVQGWSTDSRWGRWMLYLALAGPAAGAALGSGIGLFLVRLHVLPESVLIASAGLVGVLMAAMIVPQVVQDFSVAWIHLQMRRTEANQAAEKG